MRALPDALASQKPDLILLQELWEPEHAAIVARGLQRDGYPFARHLARSLRGQTGLFVASKWPLTALAFQRYALGRLPHSFWHLDWLVSKGVGTFWLETPLGRVLVENTHLQAQYVTDTYEGERLSQASELLIMNRRSADTPLILGGDFNSGVGESPRQALAGLGHLYDANPTPREDTVYVRDGRDLAFRVVAAGTALGEPRALDDGARIPLSDHAAVLVELELSPGKKAPEALPEERVARAETLAALTAAAEVTRGRVAMTLLGSFVLLGLASFWRRKVSAASRRSARGLAVRRLGFSLLAIGFAWCFYLGTIYYPLRGAGLRQIANEIAKW